MNYVDLLAAYDKLEAEHCMVLESVVLDAETIHRLEAELAKAHEYGYQYRQERNRAEAELATLKAERDTHRKQLDEARELLKEPEGNTTPEWADEWRNKRDAWLEANK
jgi:uncharacterized protein YlxW (UPF0749 family)